MSPEQLEACSPTHARTPDSLGPASDVFSLGVILWELATGRRPWGEEQMEATWSETLAAMTERRNTPFDPATTDSLRRAAGEPLAEVILKCLAPDAGERMPSSGELARQLRLCLRPEALEIMRPPRSAWMRAIARWPLPAMLLIALAPNVLAAIFNFAYNREQIVSRLDDSLAAFWNIQAAVNGVAFPLGIGLLVYLAWPLQRAMSRDSRSHPLDGRNPKSKIENPKSCVTSRLRRRALDLGHIAAVVGVALWLVAGVVYPVAMNALGVSLSPRDYAHFMSSLALCGLIAAVYPFFGITWLGVRLVYPALACDDAAASFEAAHLARLGRRTSVYLALAGCLPMLGVAALVLLAGAANRFALTGLCIAGVAGFGLVFYAAARIQRHLQALREAITPSSSAAGR
jgi:hypothetical protein